MGSVTDRMLGAGPVAATFTSFSASRIRILAYHAVTDAMAFRRQLEHLAAKYRPVSGAEVASCIVKGEPLPRRAVWVTFDDGDPSVVDVARPLLRAYGIPATMFVCPSVLDTCRPLWWQPLVDRPDEVARLKHVPDVERRAVVQRGPRWDVRQLTTGELRQWLVAGNEIGNHTWDHPCLDRCDEQVQRDQIIRGHAWLEEHLGVSPHLFAYPNGNTSLVAIETLEELGYSLALLFDHRLADRRQHPLGVSRLRIDSGVALPRFRAIVSGTHSFAMRLR